MAMGVTAGAATDYSGLQMLVGLFRYRSWPVHAFASYQTQHLVAAMHCLTLTCLLGAGMAYMPVYHGLTL